MTPPIFVGDALSADDPRLDARARALIRIGETAIAREDDVALRAYFSEDFVFHGSDGDLGFDELRTYFAAMRAAFSGFAVTRQAIISEGDHVAAHTTMAGLFDRPFEFSPIGRLEPTGRRMTHRLTNLFRFDAQGRLAEEWAMYDSLVLLRELGVRMKPAQAEGSMR